MKTAARWCWRRWIAAGAQDLWMERLRDAGCMSWAFTEKPEKTRVRLEAYVKSRAGATALEKKWRGNVRAIKAREWMSTRPTPPTRIGRKLEIVHDEPRGGKKPNAGQLAIPHGLAFGSGEHGTTYMLLRELARRGDWTGARVLDLGTGSGVLALAARLLGAQKIVATDFDPDAVRTARQNEALNFSRPLIRWQRADVKKLTAKIRYDLVVANLFSGILVEAARQIGACVASGGELWLSGILASQEREVKAAYRGQGLKWTATLRRGKWVMVMFVRPG